MRRAPKVYVDVYSLRRAKYLDIREIRGSEFVVTDAILRAPFAQTSSELRAAADRVLVVELETSVL